jgi:hypothetical protein
MLKDEEKAEKKTKPKKQKKVKENNEEVDYRPPKEKKNFGGLFKKNRGDD